MRGISTLLMAVALGILLPHAATAQGLPRECKPASSDNNSKPGVYFQCGNDRPIHHPYIASNHPSPTIQTSYSPWTQLSSLRSYHSTYKIRPGCAYPAHSSYNPGVQNYAQTQTSNSSIKSFTPANSWGNTNTPPSTSSSTTYTTGEPLTEAIGKYRLGDFSGALALLESGHFNSKQAAEAHYYKGLCLNKSGRNSDAEREFKLAKLFDKTGKISPLAKLELDKLSTPANGSSVAIRSSGDPKELKDCAQRILGQSKERIGRVWSEDYRPRPSSRTQIHDPCRPIYGSIYPAVAVGQGAGRPPHYFYRYGNTGYSHGQDAKFAQDKAKNVADSAEGLIKLLTREDNGKGVFLVPEGTNLYVRNYEYGASIDPPVIGLKTDVPMLALPRPEQNKKDSK